MGIGAMAMPWVFSSTFLPHSGEPIDFLLEDRDEPIHGTFEDGGFHSRWANYDSARVRSWRQAPIDPEHEVIGDSRIARPRKVLATLARVAMRLVGKNHRIERAVTATEHNQHPVRSAHRHVAAAGSTTQR
jgi:hypothetical protein